MKKSIELIKTIKTKEELSSISLQDIVSETIPRELENWDNECEIQISISVSAQRYTDEDKRRIEDFSKIIAR